MITREILEAQLGLYQQARQQSVQAIENAKANFSAASGAIEACENFLRILGQLEVAQSQKSSEAEVVEVEPKK